MISAHWSFIRDTDVPKPGAGEVVMTKAWVERGLSLPCSEFFLSILSTNPSTTATRTTSQEPIMKYMKKSPAVLHQPSTSHTTPPSPQADQSLPRTLQEIIPVSSEKVGGEDPKAKGPALDGEVQGQGEAEVTSSEKAEAGVGDVVVFPKNFGDPADLTSTPKAWKWELEQDLLNAMLNNAWGKPDAVSSEIQDFKKEVGQFFDKLICKQKVLPSASSSLATTSSELENLRSSYQELETKLMEAEQKREQAEKQLAEKNSELIDTSQTFHVGAGFMVLRRTLLHQQPSRASWLLEPLGYLEKRRNMFPRDDLLQLAVDDCKDLISASRKICHNLSIKRIRTSGVRKLVKKMDVLLELVTDLQASSARGAAAMTLTMCLAHNSELDLDRVTTGVPPEADVGVLLDAVSGYDTRIARRSGMKNSTTKSFFLLTSHLKLSFKRSSRRPGLGIRNQFTWTSSKDATQDQPKDSAATSEEKEESDEDVSSPAGDAEEGDPKGQTSPAKED
ncbi:hypothetical protein QYE76_028237 [Lolium multiflorum]|uniref:Uncharacterized protein n=1 Tax=Lolium multiflorum TaxID=4521 RepID=A0AAD8VFK9_LOLMU|nr:hypothetical protein QYE76_028237 [Lolium multiflorum]